MSAAISSESLDWKARYEATRLETDATKLPQKILDAELAMFRRKLQLSLSVKGDAEHAEINAINEALARLVVVRRRLDLRPRA
jgi:hypothetical protein